MRLMAETEKVSQVLAGAMRDEDVTEGEWDHPATLVAPSNHMVPFAEGEAPSEPLADPVRAELRPPASGEKHSTELCFEGLDTRFHSVLSQLLSRPVWHMAEFDSLARDLKLMPAGALDAVNTCALRAI